VYRAVDQYSQVVDVYVSTEGDTPAAVRFFMSAIGACGEPVEVTTDRSAALASAICDPAT
jgi:transposase-like protein